ncbi:diacylglycerol/lipid kinase family protein [Cellulomonas aerilata]|uniref:DAGKc domain-containing protein n=1 Tax=Cellulomonas aerilata TaxID=515326 RepID=A0A512DAE1_9CELL|nr:diacylglycerol kinase family protein [Cellulomonas aerilata]GEO33448.1 hypothetical protein CAE01nite_11730 [Cellulomonas aerilata]
MSRLGVLLNPVAGGGRGRRAGEATVQLLRRRGHRVSLVEVPRPAGHGLAGATGPAGAGGPADAADLHGLDGLVVVGGDGTVHAGLQLTAGTGLPLGVVPAGSGNDVARCLGVPRGAARGDVAAAVRVLEDALTAGPRTVDAVTVAPVAADLTAPPARAWFVGVLSCGFDAAVNARANAMTWPRGSGRYVRAVAAELGGFRPYGYRLVLDDAVWQSAGTLVAVANTPRFGGGIAIAPDASVDDGLLDVVVARPVTRPGVAALLPGAYRGRHVRHPAVQVLRTRGVLIEPDPTLGRTPPVAFADGEPIGPLPLRVDVRPGALAVLA